MKPLAISVSDACKICGVGRTTLYQMLKNGSLESKLVGRKRLVIVKSIERYFEDSEKY